jgi:hypothetical protein
MLGQSIAGDKMRTLRWWHLLLTIVVIPGCRSIARGLLRILLTLVVLVGWIASVVVVVNIVSGIVSSDSPLAVQIAGQVAVVVFAIGSCAALVVYATRPER